MSKIKILFIIGVLVALLPYMGFPYFLKNILFTLLGLGIAIYSYIWGRESRIKNINSKTFENFVENNNFPKVEIKTEEIKIN